MSEESERWVLIIDSSKCRQLYRGLHPNFGGHIHNLVKKCGFNVTRYMVPQNFGILSTDYRDYALVIAMSVTNLPSNWDAICAECKDAQISTVAFAFGRFTHGYNVDYTLRVNGGVNFDKDFANFLMTFR